MKAEDEREFAEYFTARLPHLLRAAYLLTGDAHRADDVVQAALTALYRHWAKVKAADNVDAYVQRVLVRQFLDEKRLAWSRVFLSRSLPDRPAAPAEPFEVQDLVHTALRKLPRGQRAVLVLRFLCDQSVEDTALALRCSTGNVKSQTARALGAMRELLASADVRSVP